MFLRGIWGGGGGRQGPPHSGEPPSTVANSPPPPFFSVMSTPPILTSWQHRALSPRSRRGKPGRRRSRACSRPGRAGSLASPEGPPRPPQRARRPPPAPRSVCQRADPSESHRLQVQGATRKGRARRGEAGGAGRRGPDAPLRRFSAPLHLRTAPSTPLRVEAASTTAAALRGRCQHPKTRQAFANSVAGLQRAKEKAFGGRGGGPEGVGRLRPDGERTTPCSPRCTPPSGGLQNFSAPPRRRAPAAAGAHADVDARRGPGGGGGGGPPPPRAPARRAPPAAGAPRDLAARGRRRPPGQRFGRARHPGGAPRGLEAPGACWRAGWRPRGRGRCFAVCDARP